MDEPPARQDGQVAQPAPRWLDAEQLRAWRSFSAMMVILSAELDAQMQRHEGVNEFEYNVMAGLSEAPDRTLRIGRLALASNGSLSRLSHLIKRLELRGWARREPCPEDGRYTNAVLTDEGYAKLLQAAPRQVTIVRELVIDVLTPDQLRELGHLSDLLTERIQDGPAVP
jgi:DNA-binding MarR family transcriptional regulator